MSLGVLHCVLLREVLVCVASGRNVVSQHHKVRDCPLTISFVIPDLVVITVVYESRLVEVVYEVVRKRVRGPGEANEIGGHGVEAQDGFGVRVAGGNS